jgi:hypothetical protein
LQKRPAKRPVFVFFENARPSLNRILFSGRACLGARRRRVLGGGGAALFFAGGGAKKRAALKAEVKS